MCTTRCTWTQSLATCGLATTLATVEWMKPSTPLAIEPENVESSWLSLVSPLLSSSPATCLVTPWTLI